MYNFNVGPTDTDSISFCKPDGSPFSKEERQKLLNELNVISPDFMEWGDDGYYRRCVALKAKNYVLQKYLEDLKPGEKEFTIKGSAFKNSRLEPALKEMLNEFVDAMINDKTNFVEIYHKYVKEANNIQDINRWTTKRTITDKVLEGERKNETKLKDAMGDDNVQEGDKVRVYNTISGEVQAEAKGQLLFDSKGKPKMIPNRILMQSKYFDGHYDVEHYLGRVYSTVEIFSTLLDMEQFKNYKLKRNKDLLNTL